MLVGCITLIFGVEAKDTVPKAKLFSLTILSEKSQVGYDPVINDKGTVVFQRGVNDAYIKNALGTKLIEIPSTSSSFTLIKLTNDEKIVASIWANDNSGSGVGVWQGTNLKFTVFGKKKPNDASESGLIVGANYFIDEENPSHSFVLNKQLGFLKLPSFFNLSKYTEAEGVNDKNQIVGTYENDGFFFDLRNGNYNILKATHGYSDVEIKKINIHEMIIGTQKRWGGKQLGYIIEGTIWLGKKTVIIPRRDGVDVMWPIDLNDSCLIIGSEQVSSYNSAGTYGFISHGTDRIDLLESTAGSEILDHLDPTDINNAGEIVGEARPKSGGVVNVQLTLTKEGKAYFKNKDCSNAPMTKIGLKH